MLAQLKKYAAELGFDACGAARCRTMPEAAAALQEWMRAGNHAGMKYMENHAGLRLDPARLAEGTRSVIVCLISYKPGETYRPGIPQVAAYARSADYHHTVKQKLERLLGFIRTLAPGTEGRCFVDSAPIFEKNWAVEAGLGWPGKNSLLIHPQLGSFCFIGIILTTLELDGYDPPFTENRCGDCRACADACPTGAIADRGGIDARRCLAYQTIENRGPVPEELLPALGGRLFGCDACQDACPWNVRPEPRRHDIFRPLDGIYDITAQEWLRMGGGEFRRRFVHTPLARAGLKKLKLTLTQKGETASPE